MRDRRAPQRNYPRTARLNELLRQVVAEALERIDDDRLVDVTVTAVDCEADLRRATVLIDTLAGSEGDADADAEVLGGLEEVRVRLQGEIGRQTDLKRTPLLTFAFDPVVRSAGRIEEVLRGLDRHDVEPGGPMS